MIIQNGILVKSTGQIFLSRYRHDYQEINLEDSSSISIDGGYDYIHRSGLPNNLIEDISLDYSSPFSEIRCKLVWGTCGKDGKEPLRYLFMSNLELSHLKNIHEILKGVIQPSISQRVVEYWINKKEGQDDNKS